MDIIPALFLVTLLIALVGGLWQWARVRKARREHHRSAAGKAAGESWDGR